MQNKEPSAETTDKQRTKADFSTSDSVEANPLLSTALSVEEDNKLIAIFMGEMVRSDYMIEVETNFFGLGTKTLHRMEYHSSWDWLMPAVNKFINENTRPVESRDLNEYRKHCNALYNLITDFNITDVFNYFVKAIKWYNAVSVGSR